MMGRTGTVRLRKSIATVSLSGTLEEKLSAAAQVGFDGVEVFESDFISCALTPKQIRERADELGLRLELYQPLRDVEGVSDEVFTHNLRRARSKFEVMSELGIETILLCSNVSVSTVDDDALVADQLTQLAELAALYGVRVAYEALAWGRHVNDYRRAGQIVARADHPGLGVCLDSFHILSRRHDPAAILDIPADKLFFLQLADAPEMHLDVLQWSRHYRCFPGQGTFDLDTFLSYVLDAGYRGPLSLEVFNDVFRQADAERTATDALRSLIALEESVGIRLDQAAGNAAQSAQGASTRERIELMSPPPAADLSGYSFVEITVDPLAELGAEYLLRSMGFRRVSRHRSKPVHMWQQGGARVLLNRTRPAKDGWPRGDAAVTAIAVETDDPARSARRAQMLLAPAIPRRYGPGEADLFATEAPDSTSVFFCRTDPVDGVPGGWVDDFEPLAATGAVADDLLGVDHVALSQPAFYFDEAALFYQSVLGLRPSHTEDIADPYGLVRSRAVTSADGRTRLVLNVPALAGGELPETAQFQHIAFAASDIFSAASAMRERKLPTLAVPGNYYRDLAGRTGLDASVIEAMRARSILYDHDDEGGEFFHFYTMMLGRRMFFEIVQRVNGYDGYGTANTPVRMAAQYRQTVAGIMG